MAIWAVLLGAIYLAGGPRSPSMAHSVTPPWSWIFAVGLVIGGVLTLGGSFWSANDVDRGLDLERAGLITLTGALLVYVAAVFTTTGWPGLTAAGFATAWTYANVRRAVGITRDLRRLRVREIE